MYVLTLLRVCVVCYSVGGDDGCVAPCCCCVGAGVDVSCIVADAAAVIVVGIVDVNCVVGAAVGVVVVIVAVVGYMVCHAVICSRVAVVGVTACAVAVVMYNLDMLSVWLSRFVALVLVRYIGLC